MDKHNKPDARFVLGFASHAVPLIRKGARDSSFQSAKN